MNKLEMLRSLMKREKIDTYLITKFDPHNSEYSPRYWNGVQFISGFTGSSGTIVVTQDDAGLWTDGRYYIQANKQLEGTGIRLHKAAEPTTKDFFTYAKENTKDGGVIAFDGRTLSMGEAEALGKFKNIKIKTDVDLINEFWEDRPQLSSQEIYEHDIKFAGKTREQKINETRNKMSELGAEIYVISSTDDIAWLFNLRGNDNDNCTTFASFAVITKEEVILFVHNEKIKSVKGKLEKENIIVKEYEEVYKYLEKVEKTKTILVNPDCTNYYMYKIIKDLNVIEENVDITSELKGRKNEVELANIEKANVRDGVAMVRLINWIRESVSKGEEVTEIDVAEKAYELRKKGDNFICESFDCIVGYMANGAMMHYKATEESHSQICNEGILLIDSGGNYMDGTTDITRTFSLGKVTDGMKDDFTLVLKGHISLATTTFLYGATGSSLDVLARKPLWDKGIDYKCGTGHGLGYFLNVHEGPQRISMIPNNVKMEVGMLTTNEPGIYREGEYGIRTENTLLVVEKEQTQFGRFLKFETISYCPIDLNLINKDIMTNDEISWLNSYHETVYEKVSPFLNDSEKEWLKNDTKKIPLHNN